MSLPLLNTDAMSQALVQNHRELVVYQVSFETATRLFELSQQFPIAERYSLTDPIRRSSRSVCATLAAAWQLRTDQPAFISKLDNANAAAAETQTWIEFAVRCGYLDLETGRELHQTYDRVLALVVKMSVNAENWTISR